MTIDLYYHPISAPCRAVLLAAKSIGVELNLIVLNLFEQEHLTPEYIKLNPQHTIPTINDNGFVLWESRAIVTYLQNQYGKDDSLYPKDPKKRAVVDQRLYFGMDMEERFHHVYNRSVLSGAQAQDPEKVQHANKSLEFLDTFLKKTEYIAGDNLTLADFSAVVQISNLEALTHDITPYKNIQRWYAKIKATVPGYKEANEDNLALLQEVIKKFSKPQ